MGSNYSAGGGTLDATVCIGAISIGSGAYAGCDTANDNVNTVAIGANSVAAGSGVALGSDATASGAQSTAIGVKTVAAGSAGVALGSNATASGAQSTAIGVNTVAGGDYSLAAGAAAKSSGNGTVAIGMNASATLTNSVALGVGSVATTTSSTTANTAANGLVSGKTFTINQAPVYGVVAVGNRQIQGVADGQLSGTSTDAVNGSQLFQTTKALNSNISTLGGNIATALGGSAAYNTTTGAWTAPSYTIQGSNYGDIGSALTKVDSGLTTLNTNVTGNTAAITNLSNGTMGLVKQDATTNAITVAADKAGTSVNIAGTDGERTLSGVSAGKLAADSTDAVNGSQLFATNTNLSNLTGNLNTLSTSVTGLGNGVAAALGGGASYDSNTGTWTAPTYSVQGINYSSVGAAFSGVDNNLTNLNNSVAAGTTGVVQRTATADVATLTAAGGNATNPGNAQKLTNLANGNVASGSTDAVNGSQLYEVAAQVSQNTADIVGLTTIVNNVNENNLVKQDSNDKSITIGANKDGKSVSIAGTEGNRTLTGLNDGVSVNDAATVGQLQNIAGNNSTRDDSGLGVAKATGQDSMAVGAGSTASGDLSTASGANSKASGTNSSAYGSESQASGTNSSAIGNGAQATAANSSAFGQGSNASGAQSVALGQGSSSTGSGSVALGHGSVADRDNSVSVGSIGNERQITNVAAGTSRTDAANVGQVNDAFQSLGKSMNKKINDLDDKLTGGVASAMAMSGIPQAYLPDSNMVGASASTYNGQSAIAVGVSKTSENGKWILKINASGNTQSDFGASAGVGYQW